MDAMLFGFSLAITGLCVMIFQRVTRIEKLIAGKGSFNNAKDKKRNS
jgi:hypothetical protein